MFRHKSRVSMMLRSWDISRFQNKQLQGAWKKCEHCFSNSVCPRVSESPKILNESTQGTGLSSRMYSVVLFYLVIDLTTCPVVLVHRNYEYAVLLPALACIVLYQNIRYLSVMLSSQTYSQYCFL